MISLFEENRIIDEMLAREYNPLADNVMNGNVLEKLDELTAEEEKPTNFPTFEINEKLVLTNVDLKVVDNVDGIPEGRAYQNIFGELTIGVTKDKAIVIKLYKDEE